MDVSRLTIKRSSLWKLDRCARSPISWNCQFLPAEEAVRVGVDLPHGCGVYVVYYSWSMHRIYLTLCKIKFQGKHPGIMPVMSRQ